MCILYPGFEHILQKRTHAVFVSKYVLNLFSQMTAFVEDSLEKESRREDWYWKIVGNSLKYEGIEEAWPMAYHKKSYWGNKLARFHSRIMVRLSIKSWYKAD